MLYFEQYATVQDVLNLKSEEGAGHDGILSIPFSATIEQTISFMDDHAIGCVFLRDPDKKIIGLVSEHDIIQYLARNEKATLKDEVRPLMNTDLLFCYCDEKLKHISSVMAEHHVRHIAVKNKQGDLIGVVSSRDIERFAGNG